MRASLNEPKDMRFLKPFFRPIAKEYTAARPVDPEDIGAVPISVTDYEPLRSAFEDEDLDPGCSPFLYHHSLLARSALKEGLPTIDTYHVELTTMWTCVRTTVNLVPMAKSAVANDLE